MWKKKEVNGFMLSLASLLLLTSGARISFKSQVGSSSKSQTNIGPQGENWVKYTKYVCIQEWRSSNRSFSGKFCLVKYMEVLSITPSFVRVAGNLAWCDAAKVGSMNVCPLEGAPQERAIFYQGRAHISKACFRMTENSTHYAVLEAALDEGECEEAATTPVESQVILPVLPPTTTVTTTTTTTTSETKPVAMVVNPTELIEIKSLFSEESERWLYNGAAYKCCTSSADKPAMLQNMNAAKLPSTRPYGTQTGCGRMFGDTYHNGLNQYDGAKPSCPVRAQLLLEITGDDYWRIRNKLPPPLN